MKHSRQFENLVKRESRKLEIEIRRGRRYKRQHLPVDCVLQNKRWSLGFNRFRRW